jgi:formylglycine-generating enzyme required for sulfatase activity
LGKSVIPEDKKKRIIVIIFLIIIAVLGFFILYNTVSKKQPGFATNRTSVAAKGAGSSNQSGSAAVQSAGTNSISADEYAQQEQSISRTEQAASQQGQSTAAGQRLSQTGSIFSSGQSGSQQGSATGGQRLSQTGSVLSSGQASSQQGSTAAGQLLSQTGSLSSGQTATQQGSTEAGQRLSQTGSLSSGQTATQQESTEAGQHLSQTGSLSSGQTATQQESTEALSQTGSLSSEQAAAQQGQAGSQGQGISAAAQLALQEGQSIFATGQTSQSGVRANSGNTGGTTGTASTTSSVSGQAQQNEAISQREFQNARRTTPAQPAPPPVRRIISANMLLVNSGSFEMENVLDEQDTGENAELLQVTITSFYIAKYEVTQREYENVMGKNPSYFKGSNLPVENVSWFDAIEYCNALSRREGLNLAYTITGSGSSRVVTWNRNANGYRLPTEEEWVYACRANTTTPFNTGNSISRNMSNYFGRRTVNVGSYPPNAWGLYDMHGNVSEWCWNLNISASDNITRVIRGGSWLNTSMRLRSSFRDHYFPQLHTMSIGFRIVQSY